MGVRRAHEHWDDSVKEKALALLTSGYSLRKVARDLNVPYTTLRDWRISDDPVAKDVRSKRLAQLVAESWEAAEEMVEKIRSAPVQNVQQAAVAYGILVERAIMAQAQANVVTNDMGKKTLADFMREVRLQREAMQAKAARPAVIEGTARPLPTGETG
jgi:transposase-like protein